MREVFRWDNNSIFFVDRETLSVYLPDVNQLNLEHSCRQLVFEVSLSGGFEWTTQEDEATYTFKPTPQILRYSHDYSDQRGLFHMTVFGFQFEDNILKCDFGPNLRTVGKFKVTDSDSDVHLINGGLVFCTACS